MAADNKKRHIVSYENMSRELAEAFAEKYPKGFNDYLPDIVKYTKPDGTPFYAVMIEVPDAIYLVKIKVKIDDADDIERWLEGEEDAENEQVAGATAVGGEYCVKAQATHAIDAGATRDEILEAMTIGSYMAMSRAQSYAYRKYAELFGVKLE